MHPLRVAIVNIYTAGIDRIVGPDQGMDFAAFRNVTEGRCPAGSHAYGWCGDAASFALMSIGYTDPTAINRVATRGKWTPGANLTSILAAAQARGAIISNTGPLPGGTLFIKKAAAGNHIGVVSADTDASSATFTSLDGNGWGYKYTSTANRKRSDLLYAIDPVILTGLQAPNPTALTVSGASTLFDCPQPSTPGVPGMTSPSALTSSSSSLFPTPTTAPPLTSGDAITDW